MVIFYVYAVLSKISNDRYKSTKQINRIHRVSSGHNLIYSLVLLGFELFGLTWESNCVICLLLFTPSLDIHRFKIILSTT
jgi:hypothetical protein